jgi:glycosidase
VVEVGQDDCSVAGHFDDDSSLVPGPSHAEVEEYKDVKRSDIYAEAVQSGDQERLEKALDGLRRLARDHSRLSFQWDDSPKAGFNSAAGEL